MQAAANAQKRPRCRGNPCAGPAHDGEQLFSTTRRSLPRSWCSSSRRVLRGQSERLKGYTIGVEVLRRDTSFDPQIDPIVRVEATRLRRAIERYYAGPGANDLIAISLPRGGYVPRIAWRARTAGALPAAVAPAPAARRAAARQRHCRRCASRRSSSSARRIARLIDGETLSGKLCEAFALFDMINVVGGSPCDVGRALRLPSRRRDRISRRRTRVCASGSSTRSTRPSSGRAPSSPLAAGESAAAFEHRVIARPDRDDRAALRRDLVA